MTTSLFAFPSKGNQSFRPKTAPCKRAVQVAALAGACLAPGNGETMKYDTGSPAEVTD